MEARESKTVLPSRFRMKGFQLGGLIWIEHCQASEFCPAAGFCWSRLPHPPQRYECDAAWQAILLESGASDGWRATFCFR